MLLYVVCSVSDIVCELCVATISNILGVVVILLLDVMEVLRVGRSALLDIPCMIFQTMCMLRLCIKMFLP